MLQWVAIVLVMFALSTGLTVFTVYRVVGLADDGHEAHVAMCAYKRDLAQREADNKAYLAMTHRQRVAKYGEALASIPPAVIKQSIETQQSVLDSLHTLQCN